jgi:hypothetical protein
VLPGAIVDFGHQMHGSNAAASKADGPCAKRIHLTVRGSDTVRNGLLMPASPLSGLPPAPKWS